MCNCYALGTQYFAGNGGINGRTGFVEEPAGVYPDREPVCNPEYGSSYFPYCGEADCPRSAYRCDRVGSCGCERFRPPRPCGNNRCCIYLLLLLLV